MTKAQKNAFIELWPQYGLDLSKQISGAHHCFESKQPLVVEIGFGMGDSLVTQAQSEPDRNFIGIEVHKPGVGSCLINIDKLKLKNLKLFNMDAIQVLENWLQDDMVSRFQLYFPDPWHKKKHHKRRIVQPHFVDLIHQKLMHQGLFHMATDWQPYAESMHAVMQDRDDFKNASETGDYIERPSFRPVTKFEKRGQRLGHGVWDLMYHKITN